MSNKIIQLLRDEKMKKAIFKKSIEFMQSTNAIMEDHDKDEPDAGIKWGDIWSCDLHPYFDEMHRVFLDSIYSKLEKPFSISPKELTNEFCRMQITYFFTKHGVDLLEEIYGTEDVEDLFPKWNWNFERFIDSLEMFHLIPHNPNPFPICQIPICQIFDNICGCPEIFGDDEKLWSRNDIELRLAAAGVVDSNDAHFIFNSSKFPLVFASFHGTASQFAIRQIESEMKKLLPSVLRSLSLLFMENKTSSYSLVTRHFPMISDILMFQNEHLWFIRECLEGYYSELAKKDSMDRRIRNAIHLLVESDIQQNDSIGLGLCMSSIEALLGTKCEGLSEFLGNNIAVLLEPDLEKRSGCISFFKSLYDIRSRSLHGERIESDFVQRCQARHVAAAVLHAVVFRKSFMKKMAQDSEAPQDFLKDLKERKFTTGVPDGILDDYNVRYLWNNDSLG